MTKHLMVGVTTFIVGLAVAGGAVLAGGIPSSAPVMTYSGIMRDGDGKPLASVDKILQVKLWPSATPTDTAICAIPPTAITTDNLGHFSLPLDPCLDAVKENNELYIEVIVGTVSLGTAKLGAVPYAVEAAHAETADHAVSTDSAASADLAGGVFGSSVRISKDCTFVNNSHTDCRCAADEVAISGGACAAGCGINGWLAETARLGEDPRVWRLSCANADRNRIQCSSEFALCIKSGG
jgi:hypothetical protein